MPPEEKQGWEEKARQDKARYEMEKAMYKGPWKVPANKRTPKDPSAPKRPMSAFLAFSNKRRAALKRQHPDATNADLSKMLSKTWKEAPPDVKGKYTEEEAGLRAEYKIKMAKWRKKVADEKKQERSEREALAMQAAEARQLEVQNQAAAGVDGGSNPGGFGMPGGGGGQQQDMAGQQGYGAPGMYPYGMQGGYPAPAPGGGDMGGAMQGQPGNFPMMQPFGGMGGGQGQQQQQQLIQQLLGQQLIQQQGAGGGNGNGGGQQQQQNRNMGGGMYPGGQQQQGGGQGMSAQDPMQQQHQQQQNNGQQRPSNAQV